MVTKQIAGCKLPVSISRHQVAGESKKEQVIANWVVVMLFHSFSMAVQSVHCSLRFGGGGGVFQESNTEMPKLDQVWLEFSNIPILNF